MKYFYDRVHDSLSITFVDRKYDSSEEVWPGVVVDFDGVGRPIALEFPDHASTFADVEALAQDRSVRVVAPERINSVTAVNGPELRLRREALGLTQAQMAEELGVSANTVARWERGEMKIDNPRLLSLALAALAGVKKPPRSTRVSRRTGADESPIAGAVRSRGVSAKRPVVGKSRNAALDAHVSAKPGGRRR